MYPFMLNLNVNLLANKRKGGGTIKKCGNN
jgi:hypothetical protein